MADYRGWCGTCNAEINFGGHEPGCPVPEQMRDFEKMRKLEQMQTEALAEDEWHVYKTLDELAIALGQLEADFTPIYDQYMKMDKRLQAGNRFMYLQTSGQYFEGERLREVRKAAFEERIAENEQ